MRLAALLCVLATIPSAAARADTVTLIPVQDNTLYEDAAGSLSNGAGSRLFAGRTGQATSALRRALLKFDLTGHIPAGATVTAATLSVTVVQTTDGAPRTIDVHRVLASWGEGASAATGGQGSGAPAAAGSATWIHRFHPDAVWSQPGGDYAGTASATVLAGTSGLVSWSTPGLLADVQAWAADSSMNHGWVLVGDEATPGSSRALSSREDLLPANQPVLVLTVVGDIPVAQSSWGRLKRLRP